MAKHPHFAAKLATGLTVGEAGVHARVGDEAITGGGKLARKFFFDTILYRIKPTPKGRRAIRQTLLQIGGAMEHGNSTLLREIADLIDAQKRADDTGWAAKGFALAAAYIELCQAPEQSQIRNAVAQIDPEKLKEWDKEIPTLKLALGKRPHTPTVKQLWDHLGYAMGDDAPDYKTCVRWAERLGIKAPPRPRRAKGQS